MTPYEARFGKKPNVSHFKAFDCRANVLDERPGREKFDQKAFECIFVEYSKESKAYRLWDSQAKKIFISRNVRFLKTEQA